MSSWSTTRGWLQPAGKSDSFVSLDHIRPSKDVKKRCAWAASHMIQKSIHIVTLSGWLEKISVGLLHEVGSAMSLVVE